MNFTLSVLHLSPSWVKLIINFPYDPAIHLVVIYTVACAYSCFSSPVTREVSADLVLVTGMTDEHMVVQLTIDGMLSSLALDIRCVPPASQPKMIVDLQELAQAAKTNWRLYCKSKLKEGRGGRVGDAEEEGEERP